MVFELLLLFDDNDYSVVDQKEMLPQQKNGYPWDCNLTVV
jgi:hypothetical protein